MVSGLDRIKSRVCLSRMLVDISRVQVRGLFESYTITRAQVQRCIKSVQNLTLVKLG